MNEQPVLLALKRAQEVLDTAYFGLRILKQSDPSQRSAGLRNVLVFGRSVTFVIQNLRSIVGEHRFNAWYQPIQESLRANPLMKYFVEARNNLEKQGRLDVTTSGIVKSFSTSDIPKLEQPPFQASSFFMGDENGGSGWKMDIGGGETIKYYITIPESIGQFSQVFHDLPDNIPSDLRNLPVDRLCEMYLDEMAKLVADAKKEFSPHPSERPYLRVVK
ncbi:hypothetical protein [Pseudomonas alabamensis]|uniref:hypothetical protein n=1 Tax=Pseudomonas alabamensis TaxID=3064349 RepID=UPI0011A5C988